MKWRIALVLGQNNQKIRQIMHLLHHASHSWARSVQHWAMSIEILVDWALQRGGHGVWCATLNVYVSKTGEVRTEYLQEEQSLVILKMISSLNRMPRMALVGRLFSLRHLSLVFSLTHRQLKQMQQSTSCPVVVKLIFHPYLAGRWHSICLYSVSSLTGAFKIKLIDDKSIISDIQVTRKLGDNAFIQISFLRIAEDLSPEGFRHVCFIFFFF